MKAKITLLSRLVVPLLLGGASVLLPIVVIQQKNPIALMKYHGIAAIGDAMNPIATAALFFISGCILRLIEAKFWLRSSALLIGIFPLLVLAEVIAGVGHHNLFPFEIGTYIVLGVPAILGAALTAVLAREWR